MEDMLLCDRLEELWLEIDRQHLGYLESDERRGEQRARLEAYMKEFLCLAPHDRKFNCSQTAEVLHRSATTRADFIGLRAARAWAALAKYADNLILQPWRKEFREIKLYCGFYKHEVDECLVGAEQMFEAMGYQHVGNTTMTLHGVLDPDRITSVSKDAIMAELECGIMQKIWDAMAQTQHRVTWAHILDFRENHTGTPVQAVQALKFRANERLYQEQQNQRSRVSCYAGYYDGHPIHHPMSHVGHSLPHTAHMQPPQLQTQPYQQRMAHIVSPHQALPPTTYQSHYTHPAHTLKPQDLYPSNGYHYTAPHIPNGYNHQQTFSHPSSVPTAQLIELETSPVHVASHPHPYNYPLPEPVRTAEFPCSRAKDDGAGSWENWDYVYRNLESHCYRNSSRDMHNAVPPTSDSQLSDRMRGMSLARPSTPPKRSDAKARTAGDGASRNRLSKNSIELEDAVPKHRLSKSSQQSELDAAKNRKSKQNTESDKVSKTLIGSGDDGGVTRKSDYENDVKNKQSKLLSESEFVSRLAADETSRSSRRSPEPPRPTHVVTLEVSQPPRAPSVTRPNVVTLDVSPSFLRDASPVVDLPPEKKWECVTCTFLNAPAKNACEMCSKSRVRGDMKPQPCGGQECPNCTLVNEPRRNFCAACNHSLKDSPTYI